MNPYGMNFDIDQEAVEQKRQYEEGNYHRTSKDFKRRNN